MHHHARKPSTDAHEKVGVELGASVGAEVVDFVGVELGASALSSSYCVAMPVAACFVESLLPASLCSMLYDWLCIISVCVHCSASFAWLVVERRSGLPTSIAS